MKWFVLTVGIVLILILLETQVDGSPSPGRKNKNKDGSIFDSNNKGKNNLFNNNNPGLGSGTYKKKEGGMKTLKKAAVIGAVAYGSYQIGKLTSKFGSYGHHGSWGFSDWNRAREIDGFMCRDDNDCKWIDSRLFCQDYELDFQPSNLWFGGDITRIVGECACPNNMAWNNQELSCDSNLVLGLTSTLLTVVIVSSVLFVFCCCICGFLVLRKIM